MNILLLPESAFTADKQARITPQQTQHIKNILRSEPGESLKVGRLNGPIGSGILAVDDRGDLFLKDIELDTAPTPTLPVSLILAMPRPQMLKRILQTAACMGVESIHLLQTAKVEKSFWQSPSATDDAIYEHLLLGLEQGVATQVPEVHKHQRFIPFAEDILPSLLPGRVAIIAHPGEEDAIVDFTPSTPSLLAIGPEGGFTQREVEIFGETGFSTCHLGQRILKVETAVPALLAKLYL